MGKELTKQDEETRPPKGSLDPTDDVVEIDPADLFDPEEFGIRLHFHE